MTHQYMWRNTKLLRKKTKSWNDSASLKSYEVIGKDRYTTRSLRIYGIRNKVDIVNVSDEHKMRIYIAKMTPKKLERKLVHAIL